MPSTSMDLSAPCSTPSVQPTCQDEALFYSASLNALQAKSQRGTIRGYADYRVADNIKAFLDVTYSKVDGYGFFQPAFSNAQGGGTMPVALKGDNAFLNGAGATAEALRAEWLAAGKTLTTGSTAQVGKFWTEFGGRDVNSERETLRVVAGMEGALPSVLGGLVACPVIAVPTSIGYGVQLQGLAPLLTMLTTCAAGVVVCNIDNGFGAAMAAYRILARAVKSPAPG